MFSFYVQCLKLRVEKVWKEEMVNNYMKVDYLYIEKRDYVFVYYYYRKRVCYYVDNVQVNGNDIKLMFFVLYSFCVLVIKLIFFIFEI